MIHPSLGIRSDVILEALLALLHGRLSDFVYSQADWMHLVMTRRTGRCYGLSYDIRERLDAMLHEYRTMQDAEEDTIIEMTLHAVVYGIRFAGPLSRSDCPLVLLTPYEDMRLGAPMPSAVLDVLLNDSTLYDLVGVSKGRRCLQLCRTGSMQGRSAVAMRILETMWEQELNDYLAMEAAEHLREIIVGPDVCISCGVRPALEFLEECAECFDEH